MISERPFTPPRPSREDGPPRAVQQPLLAELGPADLSTWHWTNHALERCHGRNVGVFEVLSALHAPQWSKPSPGQPGLRVYVRGDLEVVADPSNRLIVTVIDRLEATRSEPRRALAPVQPVPEPVPEPEPEPEPAPAEAKGPAMPNKLTGAAAVRDWVARRRDATFPVSETIADLESPQTSEAAIRFAVSAMHDAGMLARVSRGVYRRIGIGPPAAAPAAPAPQPAPKQRRASLPPGSSQIAAKLMFQFVDELPGGPTPDDELAHVRRYLGEAKAHPSRWAQIAEIHGSPETAHRRAERLRKALGEPNVQIVARIIDARAQSRRSGIYLRYLEEL